MRGEFGLDCGDLAGIDNPGRQVCAPWWLPSRLAGKMYPLSRGDHGMFAKSPFATVRFYWSHSPSLRGGDPSGTRHLPHSSALPGSCLFDMLQVKAAQPCAARELPSGLVAGFLCWPWAAIVLTALHAALAQLAERFTRNE